MVVGEHGDDVSDVPFIMCIVLASVFFV